MILETNKVKEIFGVDFYDGSQIHKKFAYRCFRDKVLPIGNIVAFIAPMDVTINLIDQEDLINKDYIWSDKAINFIWEIPNMNGFGAVCYQRLFNTQIANILSTKYLQAPIIVDGDDLMVQKEHTHHNITQPSGKCSVSITHIVGDCALGHTGINIWAGKKSPARAYSTCLTDIQADHFMKNVIDLFYNLNDDLFISSAKV